MMCAPVAQLDRVSDYESEGRGFESLPAHQECLAEMQGILFCHKGGRRSLPGAGMGRHLPLGQTVPAGRVLCAGVPTICPAPLTITPRMRYTKLYKMQCGGVPRAGAFCREPGQVKAGRGAPGVVAPAGIPVPLRVRRRSRACRAGSVSGQAVSRFRFAPVTGRSSGFCAQNQFGWYRDL